MAGTARLLALLALGGACGGAGCGGGTPPRNDAPTSPTPIPATNANPSVFEGMGRVVTFVEAAAADFTGATVRSEDGALEVVEQVCGPTGCAVIVRVLDTIPDAGRSMPSPADATNRFLRIERPGIVQSHRALFSVLPLDAIRNDGVPASVRGTLFASSLDTIDETVFTGIRGLEPVRWFVFGDAELHGVIDVAASSEGPGPGGGEGTTSAATSPGAGAAGSATGGGGGGGSSTEGVAGEGGGAGGAAFALGCAVDAFVTSDCGGGAGGGTGATAGGHGGGGFALVVLGSLDADAMVDAHGADGADGAGGGGGGRVHVSGTNLVGAGIVADTSGGAGGVRSGAAGGAGATGEAWLPSSAPIRLTTTGSGIVREPMVRIAGASSPDAAVRAEAIDGTVLATAVAGADGSFSLDVDLSPGLNRIRVIARDTGGTEHRAWEGNHLELMRRGDAVLPIGGLVDVAYLP